MSITLDVTILKDAVEWNTYHLSRHTDIMEHVLKQDDIIMVYSNWNHYSINRVKDVDWKLVYKYAIVFRPEENHDK